MPEWAKGWYRMAGHVTRSLYLTEEQAPVVDAALQRMVQDAASHGFKTTATASCSMLLLDGIRSRYPDLFGKTEVKEKKPTSKKK